MLQVKIETNIVVLGAIELYQRAKEYKSYWEF